MSFGGFGGSSACVRSRDSKEVLTIDPLLCSPLMGLYRTGFRPDNARGSFDHGVYSVEHG